MLAAGASRRFGVDNKLLSRIGGRTLIERVVNALAMGGAADIVVVTGHDYAGVEAALRGRPVRFVHNADWETGMGSSIQTGIAALDDSAAGAFVVPGDMPLLSSQLVASLVDAFAGTDSARIVYPTTRSGEQRNPVLWPRRQFGALLALPPGTGAKALLQLVAAECLAVGAEDAALSDVDTPADLAALRVEGQS
ncbi:MAG TPA: nucleotidyltransferase family protein [Hyphomicrobium sp.]